MVNFRRHLRLKAHVLLSVIKNNTLLLLSSSKGKLYSHELQSNKKESAVTKTEIWSRLKPKSAQIYRWSKCPCAFKE